MSVESRPFSGESDVAVMTDLVSAATAAGAPYSGWNVGDVLWGLYQNTEVDTRRDIRFWQGDDGTVAAFAWFHPPRSFDWHVYPRLPDGNPIEDDIIAWAVARSGESADDTGMRTLTAAAETRDAQRLALLERHGFVRTEKHYVQMRRSLDVPLPDAAPPAGTVVRHVGGENEYEQRVAIHREVWQPSRVTLDAYRRLRTAPGYVPELDLVAVAPDGTFAAYCICWLDQRTRSGEFEPVGTRAAFRRQGMGTAVMLEGLRRLKARGAESAVVYSTGSNEAAIRLYESVGFHIADRNYDYVKAL